MCGGIMIVGLTDSAGQHVICCRSARQLLQWNAVRLD